MIPTRRVGRTDLSVSEIALGGAALGNLGQAISDAQAGAVVEAAWAAGIRFFDTAPHYGRGLSETRLGRALASRVRDDYVLSTKVGRLQTPGPALAEADGFVDPLPMTQDHDYSADGILASLEASCERLCTNRIDVLLVHDIGTYTHGEANAAHWDAFLGSGLAQMQRLKAQGRIRAWGLGVNEVQVCLDTMAEAPLDVILLAGRLTLLDRAAEPELLPRCAETGTSLMLGGALNSGILATGPVPGAWFDYAPAPPDIMARAGDLQDGAEAVGLTLPQAALHFARAHPAACTVLLGTGDPDQLRGNLALLDAPLDAAARAFVTA